MMAVTSSPLVARVASRPAPVLELHRIEPLFLDWLTDPDKPDSITLVAGDTSTPLTALLGTLSTSSLPLPPSAAGTVGLPRGATVGDAAAQLIVAVHDPAGPRCRSYRAAVSYIHDLHHYSFNMTGRS